MKLTSLWGDCHSQSAATLNTALYMITDKTEIVLTKSLKYNPVKAVGSYTLRAVKSL